MHWQFGIDEAGYGPNLGPLVQVCVGFLLPEDDPSGWKTFAPIARRVGEPADDRLVIDDSKKVYASGGFAALERTVSAVTTAPDLDTLAGPHARGEFTLGGEAWYRGGQSLPMAINAAEREALHEKWRSRPWPTDAGAFVLRPELTATPRFNELVTRHGSKSAVVLDRIMSLMRTSLAEAIHPLSGEADRPVRFLCDKLGGRHFYGPFLQEVFPDGWPVAEVESPEESRYRILHLKREVTVSFMPRADAASVTVALASMVAKYLREVCMRQFNAFWQSHGPGLAPTAGYPVDAKRFYAEIEPAMARLGMTRDQVWRMK
jgi:hypothetical protein